ncbi:MAG: hypothetical protein RJB66_2645 [Pseudomonadota bacterium]|jgi:hypothetical protein
MMRAIGQLILVFNLMMMSVGCGKAVTISAKPVPSDLSDSGKPTTPAQPKPKDPKTPIEHKDLAPWRFFCIDGQTRSNILTFRGDIGFEGQPNHLLVRDENSLPITDIRRLHALTFSDLFGRFVYTGKKLEVDTIRLTPDKTSIQIAEMDFFKGETYLLGDFPIYEIPKAVLKELPWASKRYNLFGWNPLSKTLLLPTNQGVWTAASLETFKEKSLAMFPLKEFYSPMYWQKKWIWWHWLPDSKVGQLEAWNISTQGDYTFKKVLWSKGKLWHFEASDQWINALFVTGNQFEWVIFDRDLKVRFQKTLPGGEWFLGIDRDLGRPWVALGERDELSIYEFNGNDLKLLKLKVPLRASEKETSLGQLAKFGQNLIMQYLKGENRVWKRKTAEGWSSLDNLGCKDLSFIANEEGQ